MLTYIDSVSKKKKNLIDYLIAMQSPLPRNYETKCGSGDVLIFQYTFFGNVHILQKKIYIYEWIDKTYLYSIQLTKQ